MILAYVNDMALTLSFSPGAVCAGGNHFVCQYTAGAVTRTLHCDAVNLRVPLTTEEWDMLAVLLQRAVAGQTAVGGEKAALGRTTVNITAS